jgi:hypothetical protein
VFTKNYLNQGILFLSMSWNQWPYWKKFGLIAAAYAVYALLIQILVFEGLSIRVLNDNWIFVPVGILQWPFVAAMFFVRGVIFFPILQMSDKRTLPFLLGSGLLLVLFAMLVGFVVDKIKSK